VKIEVISKKRRRRRILHHYDLLGIGNLNWLTKPVLTTVNRKNLSKQCVCFYYYLISPISQLNDYISREEFTALQPYCSTDYVTGNAFNYLNTEDFMKEHWVDFEETF